jgi:hypothetical protein
MPTVNASTISNDRARLMTVSMTEADAYHVLVSRGTALRRRLGDGGISRRALTQVRRPDFM